MLLGIQGRKFENLSYSAPQKGLGPSTSKPTLLAILKDRLYHGYPSRHFPVR